MTLFPAADGSFAKKPGSFLPEMGKFMDMLREADKTLNLGLEFSTYLDREDREAKNEYLKNVEHMPTASIPGDTALMSILYDARINADGSVNAGYKEQLDEMESRSFGVLTESGNRKQALETLGNMLTAIPDEQRTAEQKKAMAAISGELDKVPALREAEEFGKGVYDKGWMAGDEIFRNMYLAGKEFPPDHEHNKLLNEMREGQTRFHPEFPPRKEKQTVGHGFGLVQTLQTVEYFHSAAELLKSRKRS